MSFIVDIISVWRNQMSGKRAAISFDLSPDEKKVARAFLDRRPRAVNTGIFRIRCNSIVVSTEGHIFVGGRFETLAKARDWIKNSREYGGFVIMKESERVESWVYMNGWRNY
ncbi:MAG: hypothetical protein Hyperionvirus10_15 [Hyperionvirus sp.]|uniref:Uncharacterized protein n=1 Tax=Hyperionvirus sp. TaxID=2487770 RepID=A0A3G5AE81_9VIRU|nr:MAG: hypothetical protein Hyperionvirus10_15 [Hyperionvirus sp.]